MRAARPQRMAERLGPAAVVLAHYLPLRMALADAPEFMTALEDLTDSQTAAAHRGVAERAAVLGSVASK